MAEIFEKVLVEVMKAVGKGCAVHRAFGRKEIAGNNCLDARA